MDRNMLIRYIYGTLTKRRLTSNKQAMRNSEAVRRALKHLAIPWISLFGTPYDEGQKVLVASLISTLEAKDYPEDAWNLGRGYM